MKSKMSAIAKFGLIGGTIMLSAAPAMAAAMACYPVSAARVYQPPAPPQAQPTANTIRYHAHGYWSLQNGHEVYVPPHWG